MLIKNFSKKKDSRIKGLWEQFDSNPEFQLLFNSMSEGIVVQNENGVIIQNNPAALEILGLTADQLYGRTSFDPNWKAIKEDGTPFPGEEHPAIVSLRTGKPVLNVIMGLKLPTGTMRWIKINAITIKNIERKRVLSAFTDITNQFKMNKELDFISQNLKNLFFIIGSNDIIDKTEVIFQNKEIFNFLNDSFILYVTDKKGNIVNVNENFVKISGFSKEELLGNNFSILNSNMHEKEFFKQLWSTILEGKTWKGQINNAKKDKTIFVLEVIIFPLKNLKGEIINFLAFSNDVTYQALNTIRLIEAQKTAKIGSWEFNLENFLQIWSDEHYRIFEISPNQSPEKLYQMYRSKIHPEDLNQLDLHINKAIKEGTGFVFNHRVLLDGGKRIKYVQGIAKVIKDQNNHAKFLIGTCQDRSEFIKLQEENKLLLKMLKIGIWKYSIKESKFFWDNLMYELYEISADDFDGNFQTWLNFIKYDKDIIAENFKKNLSSDLEYYSNFEIKMKFSNRKFIGNRAIKIKEEFSEETYLYGISWDDTGGSLKEIELLKQKDFIEKILYNIPCMIFVKDYQDNLKFKVFNKAGENFLGVSSSDFIGKTDYDFFPKDQADFFISKDKQVFIDKNVIEIPKEEISTKFGKKWLRTFKVPTFDNYGNPNLLIGLSFDITNELIQQENLKKLIDENAAILRSTKLAIITTDLCGVILRYNEEAKRILQYENHEVLNKFNVTKFFVTSEISNLAIEHSDTNKDCLENNFSIIICEAKKEIFEERKWNFIKKDGSRVLVSINFSPLKNSENVIYGYMLIAKDLTDELLMQRKLDEERTKAIHNSKLMSLGELSAGIMHEINNPLSIISSSIQLLKKSKDNQEQFEQRCMQIDKSVQRILKIVAGLKRFSRSNSNDLRELIYLSDVINEVVIIMNAKIKDNSVDLRINVVSEGKIEGDFVELEQVLINLISNAADAIKKLPDKWITINLFNDDFEKEVVLQIIDSGAGISEEIKEKIFNPFFTTKEKGEGTGLGLSISKSIIERHKGILLVNTKFKNTCFEIRLPKAVYNE
ncbi:PAS domain S-box protein [Pigmentibacter sp. JX0631]|uniref:PAS domain S-box protein n=1 Tax=Pigmentibacter sp. JX0631 TaxID=2976982 RepID=UPI0024689609|nr:PAS domain S-box protein [Pigmentibacter sp. JX0631]WGL58513.1 PAS domain S-box protein [Pigmentibacter sp. JX0631]